MPISKVNHAVLISAKGEKGPLYDLCYSPLAGWSSGLLSFPYYRKWRCHDLIHKNYCYTARARSPDQCLGGRNSLTFSL